MLLTLDVGNTNTVLGLYRVDSDEFVTSWRISTLRAQTVDEYGVLLLNLFSMRKLERQVSASSSPPSFRRSTARCARSANDTSTQGHVCGTRHQDRHAHPGG